MTIREPIGACGLILPWNYPLSLLSWKLAPLLASGSTAVIKPAENTTLSTLAFVKLIEEAGFPPGVVNVVIGNGSTVGNALSLSQDLDLIGFTGSTKTGRSVMLSAAQSNLKKCLLECGGKSPAIICEDADLDLATDWLVIGAYSNSGQICSATGRIYVHKSILDAFLEKLHKKIKLITIGDPFDMKT